jgi:hypothetical protein
MSAIAPLLGDKRTSIVPCSSPILMSTRPSSSCARTEAHLAARRDAHPLDSDGLHPDLDEGMKITAMADLKTSPAVMTLRGLRPTRDNASAHQTF